MRRTRGFGENTCRIAVLAALAVGLAAVPTPAAAGEAQEPPASLREGIDAFEAGDASAAEAFFRARAGAAPDDAWSAYYLGRVLLARNDGDGAVEWLARAAELHPESSDFHTWLGRAYLRKLDSASIFKKMGLSKKVRAHYLRAIELDPDNLGARESLAGYYFGAPGIAGGSDSRGMEQVEAIRARDRRRAHVFLFGEYLEKEEYDLAQKEIDAALALDAEHPGTRFMQGRLNQERERYDDAFASFEKALELDSAHMASVYQIGRTAALSGKNLDRGIECLESYLEHRPSWEHPGLDSANWRLGMIYEQKGDRERAREAYRTALEINPDNKQAKKALDKLGG